MFVLLVGKRLTPTDIFEIKKDEYINEERIKGCVDIDVNVYI
jgi:hypothetical protein